MFHIFRLFRRKKNLKSNNKTKEKLICDCPLPKKGRDIDYITWRFGHFSFTEFILIQHDKCGGFYGFPQDNFDLVLSKDKENFVKFLEKVKDSLNNKNN